VNSRERERRVGTIPYYGATGRVGWIDDYLFDEELVLVGEDGAPFFDKTKSIAYIVEGKSWVNNHAHVLRARSEVASNRYIKHYLDSFDFTDYVQGSTRDKLTQGAMNSIPVPIAPREVQERLVEIIDTVSNHRSSASKHLATAKRVIERFRQAVLVAACSGRLTPDDVPDDREDVSVLLQNADDKQRRLLGKRYRPTADPPLDLPELPAYWTWVRLGRLLSDGPQNGLYLPQSKYGAGGTPILRIEDYQLESSRDTDQFKRVHATPQEVERYSLAVGDIVINRVNSPSHLGKALRVSERHLPAIFESNMMRLRLLAEVDSEWVLVFLRSLRGRQLLVSNAKWAVNQASINQGDVLSVPIPLPPFDEQRQIVRRVQGLLALADALTLRIDAASKRVERSSQAVLGKAFRGELTVNGGSG
jgi:type I restriction enzyme S subunit